jgi:hypothetical protein
MDPYLEDATLWRGVHHRLISIIAEVLGDALAPAFFVAVEERVYIATPEDLVRMPEIRPDVHIVHVAAQEPVAARAAVITPPVLIAPIQDEEIHEPYLEIRDVRTREVVTTIEVVSPTNKQAGTTGRRQFMEKRRQVLASRTHWIEIDLLRGGERPPEVRGRGAYYALLHRGGVNAPYAVWAAGLRERLPTIGVPTRAPVPDTPLDLQAMVDTVYRRGHYDLALAYDTPPPPPPLPADDAAWVAERIATWRAEHGAT